MNKGYSLHIGLNQVNTAVYTGNYPTLINAENDAAYYESLASHNGYRTNLLTGPAASSTNFLNGLHDLAATMQTGDHLFFTYSGHGTRVNDLNGDEADGLDEAMPLYDRLLIDDELALCWPKFAAGVKILMLNDSCFNGTVSHFMLTYASQLGLNHPQKRLRGVDAEVAAADFSRNQDFYANISAIPGTVKCSLIHIAACGDNQLADDGTAGHGLFTATLKGILESGFGGSYQLLFQKLIAVMPPWQTPNWDTLGKSDANFEKSGFLSF